MSSTKQTGASMLGSILKGSLVNPCCDGTLANVSLSEASGNILELREDGLYSSGMPNQESIYTTNGSLDGNRIVDLQGFSLTFQNSGLFRILEGNDTEGSIYDFNDGIDFLNYDANYSANIVQNSISGISLSVTDVATTTLLNKFEITPIGYFLRNVPEYADNAAAIAASRPIDSIYRTGDALKIVH